MNDDRGGTARQPPGSAAAGGRPGGASGFGHRFASKMHATHRDRVAEEFVRDVMPHSDHLGRYAYSMTRDRSAAEDLVQETLLKAFVGFGSFDPNSSMRAWLRRIMTNIHFDNYRRAQRRPPTLLMGDALAEVTDSGPLSRRSAARSAELCAIEALPSEIARVVRTLPRNLQLALYYSHVLEYRNVEIAQTLKIPVGTVASRLHCARQRLREALNRNTFQSEAS